MIALSRVRMHFPVVDPGLPDEAENERMVFTSADHLLTLADSVLRIEHRESGEVALVPFGMVRSARQVFDVSDADADAIERIYGGAR